MNITLPPTCTCSQLCHGLDGLPVVMRHLEKVAAPVRTRICPRCIQKAPATVLVIVLREAADRACDREEA